MAGHDLLMSACGRILSGLHLLAGRPDLARRIRVTAPRRKSGAARTGVEAPAEITPDRDVAAGVPAAEVVRRDQDGEPPRPTDREPEFRAAVTVDHRFSRMGPEVEMNRPWAEIDEDWKRKEERALAQRAANAAATSLST